MSALRCKPVIHVHIRLQLHLCISDLSLDFILVVIFLRGGGSLFSHFYVRAQPGVALPPLGIPQVWSNAGRLLLGKLISMYQPSERGGGGGGGLLRPCRETQLFFVLLPLRSIPHLPLF